MAEQTHKLQKDPPEGSRKVVERELKRQDKEETGKGGPVERGDTRREKIQDSQRKMQD
jgi:hypothetical protein